MGDKQEPGAAERERRGRTWLYRPTVPDDAAVLDRLAAAAATIGVMPEQQISRQFSPGITAVIEEGRRHPERRMPRPERDSGCGDGGSVGNVARTLAH